NSDRSPLYDVRNHACRVLGENNGCEVMFRGRRFWSAPATSPSSPYGLRRDSLRHEPARLAVAGPATEARGSPSGSNRRPHACKARALPAELRPHNRKDERLRKIVGTIDQPKSTLARPPLPFGLRRDSLRASSGSPSRSRQSLRRLVGLGRLELPT